jgi:hypothetical protein
MKTRPYFPMEPPEQYFWADLVLTELAAYENRLPGVNYHALEQLRNLHQTLGAVDDYWLAAKDLLERRAADHDAAAWGDGKEPHRILPNPAFTGPVSALTVADGGLYPQLFTLIDGFINDPACTDEVKTALALHPLTETAVV